jgi:hypothetical protein
MTAISTAAITNTGVAIGAPPGIAAIAAIRAATGIQIPARRRSIAL